MRALALIVGVASLCSACATKQGDATDHVVKVELRCTEPPGRLPNGPGGKDKITVPGQELSADECQAILDQQVHGNQTNLDLFAKLMNARHVVSVRTRGGGTYSIEVPLSTPVAVGDAWSFSPVDASTRTAIARASASSGALIITRPEGLVEYSLGSGTSKPLLASPPGGSILDPAVSQADGRIVYVLQPPPKTEGTSRDSGLDLWVANRDGSAAHVVFAHAFANQAVRYPAWQDANHLMAVVQERIVDQGVAQLAYVLERFDVAGGAREEILTGAVTFGLSPDGKRAAYAALVPRDKETLNLVDLERRDPQILVDIDRHLLPFNSPRFSPDAQKVAFAAADEAGARIQAEYVSTAPFRRSESSALDGLPEDIFTVDASGGEPALLAQLKEDSPSLCWGGDGKHLYVLGSLGLYDVNLANGAVTRLGEGTFHGQLTWAPQRS